MAGDPRQLAVEALADEREARKRRNPPRKPKTAARKAINRARLPKAAFDVYASALLPRVDDASCYVDDDGVLHLFLGRQPTWVELQADLPSGGGKPMSSATLTDSMRHLERHGWLIRHRKGRKVYYELLIGQKCGCRPRPGLAMSNADRCRNYRARRKARSDTLTRSENDTPNRSDPAASDTSFSPCQPQVRGGAPVKHFTACTSEGLPGGSPPPGPPAFTPAKPAGVNHRERGVNDPPSSPGEPAAPVKNRQRRTGQQPPGADRAPLNGPASVTVAGGPAPTYLDAPAVLGAAALVEEAKAAGLAALYWRVLAGLAGLARAGVPVVTNGALAAEVRRAGWPAATSGPVRGALYKLRDGSWLWQLAEQLEAAGVTMPAVKGFPRETWRPPLAAEYTKEAAR